MGAIRQSPMGQGTVWTKLPLASAKKVAERGSIQIGWTKARVELLEARPFRCYKCL